LSSKRISAIFQEVWSDAMAAKQRAVVLNEAPAEGHGRFWQSPEQRGVISEAGKRWLEENAESIRGWNEWVEKNGLPLDKYRQF
jgi:hypothetical protein